MFELVTQKGWKKIVFLFENDDREKRDFYFGFFSAKRLMELINCDKTRIHCTRPC